MFGDLTSKLQNVFESVRSRGRLTEDNISSACDDVRKALIDADVNFNVIKDFIATVKEKALGEKSHTLNRDQRSS